MEVCKKFNEIFAEFKKLGVYSLSAYWTGLTAQMDIVAFKNLDLEANVKIRDDSKYPFEVYSVVDGVKFFAVITKGELKEHLPSLAEEVRASELAKLHSTW